MVAQGAPLYLAHCASCHGAGAAGDGPVALAGMKVPTLDGTGHSTHHALDELLETVAKGSVRGGLMPAFGQVLAEDERRAVIAYIQSLWPDAAYQRWATAQDQGSHQHSKAADRIGAAQ
jgi:mono/diheme cytochrome c family protein